MTTKRTTKRTTAKKKTAKRAAKRTTKKAAPVEIEDEPIDETEDESDEAVEPAAASVDGDDDGPSGDPERAHASQDTDADTDDVTDGDPDEEMDDEEVDDETSVDQATFAHLVAEEPDADPLPPVDLQPTRREPATREELLADFSDEYLSIKSLFEFCFVPTGRLAFLRDLAVEEDWGDNGTVLLKFLAVNVRLSIEQGAYVWNGEQLVMTVGGLTTPGGTPLYLGLVRNQDPDQNPWVMNWVGERPSCAELPPPPRLPTWPRPEAREIVVAAELTDPERRVDLPALAGISPVAQASAITGAVHWAMRRGLAVRQLHGPSMGWFVPLFLQQRDDTTDVPDGATPVMCVGSRLIVRAVLEPQVCYPAARALVDRWDQLPTWLVESWDAAREGEVD